MTEAPKKPARKKAAPKLAEPKPKAEAKKTKARTMTDQEMRETVLAKALPHAAFDGFTDAVLRKAGAEAGVASTDLARLFEDGPVSLVEFYSTSTDAEMEKRLGRIDLKAMKIRERIATAVKTRLAILKPHKEAARRAAAFLSLPMHAALGAKLMYRTVDAMWRAVGDTSTDFNFYTKRAILAGVYGSVLVRWFSDMGEDDSATEAFLDARIGNVMQFEKFKAKAKEALSNFPAFAAWTKPSK